MSDHSREAELQKSLDGLCQWLLHRFGPNSPEGKEALSRINSLEPPICRGNQKQELMQNEECVARKLAYDRGKMLYDRGATNNSPSDYSELRWRDYVWQARSIVEAGTAEGSLPGRMANDVAQALATPATSA